MRFRIAIAVLLVLSMATAVAAAGFDTKIFRAAAVGVAVKSAGPSINKFVNSFTANNHIPIGMSTKVVPILSVGEKGYVGAAQVAGPQAYVNSTQAVWLYEDNFSQNEFRLKVLVPSSSLNPLELKRVQKVGVSAIIDVSLDGRWKGQTFSHSVRAGDVLKAGVMAIAINAAASPLNHAINSISHGSDSSTKVVPIATIGDKAYIGGVQVSGSASAVRSVKAVYQYEEIFSNGRYRIKVFVPSNSTSPLKITRVAGIGITALIDTSIADQQRIREREQYWRTYRPGYRGIDVILGDRFRGDIEPRHDQGLHKGWYIGKGNQRKMLAGTWIDRYRGLRSEDDRDAFVIFWNTHYKENPKDLEKHWNEWLGKRHGNDKGANHPSVKGQGNGDDHGNGKGHGKGKNK
jgi:hypothetical protein